MSGRGVKRAAPVSEREREFTATGITSVDTFEDLLMLAKVSPEQLMDEIKHRSTVAKMLDGLAELPSVLSEESLSRTLQEVKHICELGCLLDLDVSTQARTRLVELQATIDWLKSTPGYESCIITQCFKDEPWNGGGDWKEELPVDTAVKLKGKLVLGSRKPSCPITLKHKDQKTLFSDLGHLFDKNSGHDDTIAVLAPPGQLGLLCHEVLSAKRKVKGFKGGAYEQPPLRQGWAVRFKTEMHLHTSVQRALKDAGMKVQGAETNNPGYFLPGDGRYEHTVTIFGKDPADILKGLAKVNESFPEAVKSGDCSVRITGFDSILVTKLLKAVPTFGFDDKTKAVYLRKDISEVCRILSLLTTDGFESHQPQMQRFLQVLNYKVGAF